MTGEPHDLSWSDRSWLKSINWDAVVAWAVVLPFLWACWIATLMYLRSWQ